MGQAVSPVLNAPAKRSVPVGSYPDTPLDTESLKRTGAAKDFEGLLLTQMLHSVREDGSGWLSNGDDQSGDAAIGFGEEELAKAMSASGGLGLAKLINQGLQQKQGLL